MKSQKTYIVIITILAIIITGYFMFYKKQQRVSFDTVRPESEISKAETFLELMQKDMDIKFTVKNYKNDEGKYIYRLDLPQPLFDKAGTYLSSKLTHPDTAEYVSEISVGYINDYILCWNVGLRAGGNSTNLPYIQCEDK